MGREGRTILQQEVVQAIVESKAIDFAQVGSLISKFGERAALEGDSLVQIINMKLLWCCGWPGPELDIFQEGRQLGQ